MSNRSSCRNFIVMLVSGLPSLDMAMDRTVKCLASTPSHFTAAVKTVKTVFCYFRGKSIFVFSTVPIYRLYRL